MTASSIEKCAPTETAPNYKMIWTLWSVGRKPGECASTPPNVTSFMFQGKKNQYCRSTISRAQIWMRWILLHILGFTPQATWPGTSKWTKWLQKGIVHSDSPNETSEQPLKPPKNWHIVPLWDQSWSMQLQCGARIWKAIKRYLRRSNDELLVMFSMNTVKVQVQQTWYIGSNGRAWSREDWRPVW